MWHGAMELVFGQSDQTLVGMVHGSSSRGCGDASRKRGSVIHTLTLGSDASAANMKLIAEDHSGTYRFIPDENE